MGEGKDFLDRDAIAQDATLPAPEIDIGAMRRYRLARLCEQMHKADIPLCVLTNPVSMRYATDFRNYQLFQPRIPIAYLFVPVEASVCLCVESYVGEPGGHEGEKLEQQILVADSAPVLLSDYPFEKELLEG